MLQAAADRLFRLHAPSAALALLGLAAAPAFADVRPLTLYQKAARATLVARVRALQDSTRRPPMEVLEVIKGAFEARTLTIVPFVQDYANPKPWLRREVFRKGEECVLFLQPYDAGGDAAFENVPRAGGEEERNDLFVLLNAEQGKVPVPPEGAAALSEALRRIVAILALRQHDLQAGELRGLLREKNPYLTEAGLEEVERFDLATEEDVLPLLSLTASPRDEFRAGALRILGQLGTTARGAGRLLRERQEVFTRIVARVHGDEAASVRRDAVRALRRLGGEGVEAVLRAVSASDTDQEVRYEAEIALLALAGVDRDRREAPPEGD